jgi:predicted ATP-grasp superfamily ATP-dependent carboligase
MTGITRGISGLKGRIKVRTVLIYEHITGGGLAGLEMPVSMAAEGGAMRRALVADFSAVPGVRVLSTLDARLPDEPGTIRIAADAREALSTLASKADHTILIAPETGGVLRDLTLCVEAAGGNSLGSSPGAIDLAADKNRLAAHLASWGIPTPVSRVVYPRLGLPRDVCYPSVLKPIDGAGSVDTLFVESADDPIVAAFPGELGLLQPFIPGDPRSVTFLVGLAGPALLVGVSRQRMSRIDGRFEYRGGTLLDEGVSQDHPTRQVLKSMPGLSGLVGVDYIDASPAIVLDVNPRPTTSCVGLVAALGQGRLASTWTGLIDGLILSATVEPLARPRPPLSFLADGTLQR